MATWLFEKFAPRRVAQPSEIALRKIAATPLPPGVGMERVWVNGEPVALDAWLARQGAAEYELPELVAERRVRTFQRNGPVHQFWNRRGEDLIYWFGVLCIAGAALALYFVLENLGWFRL